MMLLQLLLLFNWLLSGNHCFAEEEWLCGDEYKPEGCNLQNFTLDALLTVEDFERCSPALLSPSARAYFRSGAGRQVTLRENQRAFQRLRILPKLLQDVAFTDMSVTVLDEDIDFPIGVDPVALQRLAHPDGEVATARAANAAGTVMLLSSLASSTIEDVARAAPDIPKWMQTYIFKNRSQTIDLVRRAERSGFKAIVVTIDIPTDGTLVCNARGGMVLTPGVGPVNMANGKFHSSQLDPSLTFKDLSWLNSITRLPIVAKGILTASDASRAVQAGAAGILVSNHGGRQLDGVQASIDALPGVVDGLKFLYPNTEIYLDGGVRNGYDVFKALAIGARAVFVGRPIIWGLAAGGQKGVDKVLNILRKELNETMMLSGTRKPSFIKRNMVIAANQNC